MGEEDFDSARVRRETYVGEWLPEPLAAGHLPGWSPSSSRITPESSSRPRPFSDPSS